MFTTYLMWTLSSMLGAAWANRKVFKDFLQVKRYMAFRSTFPDHEMSRIQSDEMIAEVYAQKKRKAQIGLRGVALAAVWPLTLPFLVYMLVYEKLTGINENMAPTITIDHNRIREEEGR